MIPVVVIVLLILSCSCKEYKVVKNAKNEYYLLSFDHHIDYLRRIPDQETIEALGFTQDSVVAVNDSYLERFKKLPTLSLNTLNDSANELHRVRIAKILILAHPYYVISSYKLPGMLNPSIESVGDVFLLAWREKIFGGSIYLEWVNKKYQALPANYSHFGINNRVSPTIAEYQWNKLQEDPRLMLLQPSNELIIQYHAKAELMKGPLTALCSLRPSDSISNYANSSIPSIALDDYDHRDFRNPKNWVMFTHRNHKLLFIENINPMHILEPVEVNKETRVGSMRSIVKSDDIINLPWLIEYGLLIRGGTPAILIPVGKGTSALYLAFFHTVATIQVPESLKTYFMGAFTFCSEYPFSIHSMSSRPIVPLMSLYEGDWVKPPTLNYVVFPTGIVLVDNDTLLVSFGSQDKDGYVTRMDLTGLLSSLTYVNACASV